MDIEKYKITLQKNGITLSNDNDLIIIIKSILEAQQEPIKIGSKIRVKNIITDEYGCIYIWQGYKSGNASVYLETDIGKYSDKPEYVKPSELLFIEFIK